METHWCIIPNKRFLNECRERVLPKDGDEVLNRIEEIDDSWDDLERGGLVMYKDDDMETSSNESNRSCLSTVHGCCFAFGLKELLGFGNDRAYYSLRDTWRDDWLWSNFCYS